MTKLVSGMEVLLRARASSFSQAAMLRSIVLRNLSTKNATLPDVGSQLPAFASRPVAVNEGRKKWRFSALILFFPCVATFGLGTWQLFRRQWKIDLLNLRRSRLEEDPVPLVEALSSVQFKKNPSQDLGKDPLVDALEFRTIYCEGNFDEKRSLFVGPRVKVINGTPQNGYYMVTPFLSTASEDDGSLVVQPPILVNRGWVPSSWKDPARFASSQKFVKDEQLALRAIEENSAKKKSWWNVFAKTGKPDRDIVTKAPVERVQGVVRRSENPNIFVPPNVAETGQWFYVDVPAMAHATNLPEDTCYVEAMKKNSGPPLKEYPLAKDPDALIHSSVMPQDHLNYALTWYSLSAATTFMAIKRLQKR